MPIIDKIQNLYFVAMTDFGPDLDVHTVIKDKPMLGTLPMAIGNLKQLYIAETEKFAHITYFLNGGYADPVDGEDRIMIPSPWVESYAKIPEMSARVITQNVLDHLKNNETDFVVINYANADMVGHTGDLKATVAACEILDEQIKMLTKEVLKREGNLIITADHGNAEEMFSEEAGQPNTYHTKNPVPFIIISEKFKNTKLEAGGVLGNIAPTVLEMLEIEKPKLMKLNSLLK